MTGAALIVFPESTRRFVEPRLMMLMALCSSVVLIPELFSVVATLMLLWCIPLSPMRACGLAFKIAAPFLALLILGLVMSGDNEAADIWRDVWYVAKLCVFLALGLLLGLRLNNPEGLHKVLIVFAVFSALYSFLAVFAAENFPPIFVQGDSVDISLAGLAAIPSLVDRIVARSGRQRNLSVAILLLILVAGVLSDSRISIIGMLIMLVAWKGEFSTWQRSLRAVVGVAVVAALLWQFLPEYQGGEINALSKMRRSFEEISFTDSYNQREVYFNWRGFEAYNAQLMFEAGSAWDKLLGSGLGAKVDLGRTYQISRDMEYQFLPTIHNGFYYILIKFGIVGLAVYLLALLSWTRWGRRDFDASNLEDRVLRGLLVITLMSTTVITGLFNKEALNGMTILVAFLVGFGYRRHHDLLYHLNRRRAARTEDRLAPQLSPT